MPTSYCTECGSPLDSMKCCGSCGLAVSEMPHAQEMRSAAADSGAECPAPPGEPAPTQPMPPAQPVVIVELDGPEVARAIKWTVLLDQKSVGELPIGSRMAIPVRAGLQVISISMPRPGLIGPKELVPAIYVTGPNDFDTLIRFRLEWRNWIGYQLHLEAKRPLQAGEALPVTMASPGAERSQVAPLIVAEQPGSHQGPAVFNFQERLWQKVGIFFGLYWLWRWLLPEWMPQALRALDGRLTIVLCAVPAALLTGVEFLSWKSSAARPDSR